MCIRDSLKSGGYAAVMPSVIGYQAFMPAPGYEYNYTASLGKDGSSIQVCLLYTSRCV